VRRNMPVMCLLAVCLFAWSALPAHAGDGSLVGLTLPPYPEGLGELQGTCLSDSEEYERICDYAIAVLGRQDDPDRDATPFHVVAQRSLGRDGDLPRWRVTDALPYPHAAAGYFLQIGTCRVDGTDDGNVAALVRHDTDAEYSGDVTWARRLDFDSGRLQEIEPARIDCLNEGLGL